MEGWTNEHWEPKEGEIVLIEKWDDSEIIIREYQNDDYQDFHLGHIFPDTPEGMKAARKKAGLDQ
jgi:peptide methionine sulfoxide reductase MsrB